MAAFRTDSLNLLGQGQPERVRVAMVSAAFFDVLGLKAEAGRTFSAAEDTRGGTPVIVLGTAYWKTRFGGNPSVVGTKLLLNGVSYTVIGVAPTDTTLTGGTQAYLPIGGSRDELFWDRSVAMGMSAVARLQPGVTLEQAGAEMHTIAGALAREYPAADKDKDVEVIGLREDLVGDVRPALLMLLGAVGFVLLIACVNVANLLLARAAARRREFAIRSALGAGSRRLVRQILTEGLLLAVAGGVLGIALARALLDVIASRIAVDLPRYATIGIDARVLGFTAVASLIAGAAFAAVPAWQTARTDANATLREGGRSGSGRHRAQRVLVVGEIAIALMLTAAAGLMVRTMWHLWQVDPGFNPRGLMTFDMAGTPSTDPAPNAVRAGYEAIEQQIRAVPGVQAVSIVEGSVPMNGDSEMPFWVVGQPHATEQSQLPWALFYAVSAEYRQALGLELVRGRFITPSDTEHSPFVTVIDEELARTVFGTKNPIGEHLHFDIINVEYRDRRDRAARPPLGARQRRNRADPLADVFPVPADSGHRDAGHRKRIQLGRAQFIAGRTAGGANQAGHFFGESGRRRCTVLARWKRSSRTRCRRSDSPDAARVVCRARARARSHWHLRRHVAARVADAARHRRPHSRRRNAAVGSRHGVSNAMRMAVIGIACGAALTLLLTRLMEGLLYGVTASDPVTFASVASILGAVALLASLIPAWRATRVDPITVLRCE